MNPVLHAGAETAQLGWLLGAMTAVFFASMVGWTWWAFSGAQRQRLEAAGWLPLDDGGDA